MKKDARRVGYRNGDDARSRNVSNVVLAGMVDIPALPTRLLADCDREIAERLDLQAGDIDVLNLARARMRWPDFRRCTDAAAGWARECGLGDLLDSSDLDLMACRGARYHDDATQYGGSVFCNLFVSEGKQLDVDFPAAGRRIALERGTILLFDTAQPHGVIRRQGDHFDAAHFAPGCDCTQLFLTWELPVENAAVARLMGIAFEVGPQP